MCSQQSVGHAVFGNVAANEQKPKKVSFINYENTFGQFKFAVKREEKVLYMREFSALLLSIYAQSHLTL